MYLLIDFFSNSNNPSVQPNENDLANQPTVSPRKRSLERQKLQNFKFDKIYDDIKTPVLTPENLPGNYSIGTQVHFEEAKIKVKPIADEAVAPLVDDNGQRNGQQGPRPTYHTPNIQFMEEVTESLLDETFTEETAPFEQDSEELRQIDLPETPNETESLEEKSPSVSQVIRVSRTPSPSRTDMVNPSLIKI